MSPLFLANKTIILLEKHKNAKLCNIVLSLQESQESLNIVRSAVGVRNEKALSNVRLVVGGLKR
jgi:hypothetical protein